MVWRWCNSASSVLLLALSLTSCLTTSGGALTIEYGRADKNAKLPETTSLQGALQGVNMLTHHNRPVYGFRGIPFAEPPVGDLRFKAPVAAGTWNGTFNAISDSNACPQLNDDGGTVIGDEDCLYLNVYTPKLPESDDSTLLPVIVFIFGGAFESGAPNYVRYGPNFLLDKDVILVTPNFRLGLLGYLTTGDEVSPGNYGLKDIVLALRWVQDNIRYFGGDPNQVTLFGASSGAISVSLLALSDATNGLFHKVITDSGSAFNCELMSPVAAHVNRTIRIAEYFGCPTNSSTLLIRCLRGFNASQLINTHELFYVWQTIPRLLWFPTTEPDIEGALLTDTPSDLFNGEKVRDVPWLFSVVRDEGLLASMSLYENPDLFEEFLEKIDLVLPYIVGYWSSVDDVTSYTAALKSYYLNDLTADRSLLLSNLTDLVGDALFYYPTYHALQKQLLLATSPLYFASFEYRGVFSHTYLYSHGSTKYTNIVHGDEILYLFENFDDDFGPADSKYSEVDWVMVDTMVHLWTSFVINGRKIQDSKSRTVWEPYSSLNNYLRIGNGSDTALEMEYDLHIERMQFWTELTLSRSGDTIPPDDEPSLRAGVRVPESEIPKISSFSSWKRGKLKKKTFPAHKKSMLHAKN